MLADYGVCCICDGDGLLLHGLVDGDLVVHLHLVELVDAAHPVVRQHQRAGLDHKLACKKKGGSFIYIGWVQALLTSHSSKFQASSGKFQGSSKLEAHATSLTLSVFGTPLAPTESQIFVLLVILNGQSLTGHHIT